MPYILVFMVCIFLTSISSRKKIIPLLLSCLILSLFAGFRDKNIGSDTDFYPHWYISEIRYIHNLIYNPQIQISAESETKRSIFREKDKTKRSKKESAQHSKSRNKSFVMTSVSAL